MAERGQSVSTMYRIAGPAGLAFVAAIPVIALAALVLAAPHGLNAEGIWGDAYLWHVIGFTVMQAALSAILSVTGGLALSLALTRSGNFWGRVALLRLFGVPLSLPPLVAVLAIISIWGQSGWVHAILPAKTGFSVYGLTGILIAHVFFNMPLAARLFVARLEAVAPENWRLALSLGMPRSSVFHHIEWPVLRAVVPGAFMLVFMLCLTSFTIVLTLSGGPGTATLEVVIYQAVKFDFDLARAALLAMVQLSFIAILILAAHKLAGTFHQPFSLAQVGPPRAKRTPVQKGWDNLILVLAVAFIVLPLIALVVDGLGADLQVLFGRKQVWQALATSLILATPAALISVTLSWTILRARCEYGARYARAANLATNAILVMPVIVLGAGWFIVLHQLGIVEGAAPVIVIIVNALMAMPFAARVLAPAIKDMQAQTARLAEGLGMRGWPRMKLIEWPIMRPSIARAFAFSAALAVGDLGVIALFGSQELTTLPLLLYQSLASYRTNDAAGLALILAMLSFALLALTDKGGNNVASQ